MRRIWILRLSHRRERDKRLTTHVALTARALGAEGMAYSGDIDTTLEDRIKDINRRWGGDFKVEYIEDPVKWINLMKMNGFKIIHLTMYGVNISDIINELRKYDKLVLIVGSEKVEKIYFEISDYNVAIGNQPHSEVAAIAVFLDRYFRGRELRKKFVGGEYYIIPSERGKIVKKKVNGL
ncbi:tRNA (cytidine(56)-2'-O)-methyltransferase [Candidatus Geothermarchaeota archaeon]|nr:MAG: tRNA (cytidine(56)-2'-O)-methyltransferase [Candidatus Geothermarchaeota archaeon]RLG62971.1 MAG: tRNA (cytidine(56)-2'-O)-methyltransferase [Candidatus Geothermarchaeota archaeon]HEW93693.1 tRNA (cytidine(56)-2'-O)-methyltransferase [Thermoprotei archaeon]